MRRARVRRAAPLDPCCRVAGNLITVPDLIECVESCPLPESACRPELASPPHDGGALHYAKPQESPVNYTAGEMRWILAAERAIVRATELWAATQCSPYNGGITCLNLRRCLPCECVSVCGCAGPLRLDDLPLCGPIFEAALVWFDACGARHVWKTGKEFRVDNDNCLALQRVGEAECNYRFPAQDLTLPIGAPCTWQLEVCSGHPSDCPLETPDGRVIDPVPVMVKDAVADMAMYFLQRCLPSDKCKAPDNASRISHEGVTYELETTAEAAGDGRTGIEAWDRAAELYPCDNQHAGIFFPQPDGHEWIVETVPGGYPDYGLGWVGTVR